MLKLCPIRVQTYTCTNWFPDCNCISTGIETCVSLNLVKGDKVVVWYAGKEVEFEVALMHTLYNHLEHNPKFGIYQYSSRYKSMDNHNFTSNNIIRKII